MKADGSFLRLLLAGTPPLEIAREGESPVEAAPLPEGLGEEEVSFQSGAVQVRGILTRPVAAPGPLPGVVFLADAGPRNRDGDVPGALGGFGRELARSLAAAGHVVLRYEKREISDAAAGWAALQADALAAAAFLGGRAEVLPGRIAAVGHGEGGLLAAVLAGQEGGPLRAAAALGTFTRPLGETLEARLDLRMSARGATATEREAALAELRADVGKLRALGQDADPGSGRRVLKDLLALDPVEVLGRTTVPVLCLFAGRDPEVPAAQVAVLRAATALLQTRPIRIHVIEDADHDFRVADLVGRAGGDSGEADVARLRHADLVPLLVAFLRETLGGPAGK